MGNAEYMGPFLLRIHTESHGHTHQAAAMKTSPVLMLSALLCTLATCVNVMPPADFDLAKIAGKWYMVGLATNAEWFVTHKATMKMGTTMLAPTPGGDLDVSYANLNADGTCWRMTHLAKKTETAGRFTFRSHTWNNENDMRVVDAVYDSYAMVHTIKTMAGVPEVMNKLYSRTPEVSAALQDKFVQFALDTGVLSDNILILPKSAECSDA